MITGNPAVRLSNLAKFARRYAVMGPKESAERGHTFETGREADLRNTQRGLAQKSRRVLQPPLSEISMRSFPESTYERAMEMKGRKTSGRGHVLQPNRLGK